MKEPPTSTVAGGRLVKDLKLTMTEADDVPKATAG